MAVPVQPALCTDFANAAAEFDADFRDIGMKIHRFPGSLRGLGRRYIVPAAVAIGPYHHGLDHLREMETVKQAAAHHFIMGSHRDANEMYEAVLAVAGEARGMYTHRSVAGIGHADFAAMMFRDGCFLLQYMIMRGQRDRDRGHGAAPPDDDGRGRSLKIFLNSVDVCICNDIMLLENQLPMVVLQALMNMRPVRMDEFVAQLGGSMQIRRGDLARRLPAMEDIAGGPHLLGLVRSYIVGRGRGRGGGGGNNGDDNVQVPNGLRSFSASLSAIELAEIGIRLTPSRDDTAGMADMGVSWEGRFFGELYLAPLYLNDMKTCWLVNMAALELCTAPSFQRGGGGDTAVSSYLTLLAMLMDREESIHQLRLRGLLHGPLSNEDTLRFFKRLIMHLYGGIHYVRALRGVEAYKCRRWMRIRTHRFVYKNWKTIVTVLSIVGVLVGIFKALFSIKQK